MYWFKTIPNITNKYKKLKKTDITKGYKPKRKEEIVIEQPQGIGSWVASVGAGLEKMPSS